MNFLEVNLFCWRHVYSTILPWIFSYKKLVCFSIPNRLTILFIGIFIENYFFFQKVFFFFFRDDSKSFLDCVHILYGMSCNNVLVFLQKILYNFGEITRVDWDNMFAIGIFITVTLISNLLKKLNTNYFQTFYIIVSNF